MSKLLGYCPTCFDYLSKENTGLLLVFLRNQGNMKALQDELNISYPYVFDPVFVLVSILEWADIAHNYRGYIELTSSYRVLSVGK